MANDTEPTTDGGGIGETSSPANGDERRSIALLFTDIEGSTGRWERFAETMLDVLTTHDKLVIDAIEGCRGTTIKHTGDGLVGGFERAADAARAAALIQRRMATTDWQAVDGLRIRIAVHLGDIVDRDGELHGWAFNVASRLNGLAHGGQILLSDEAAAEARPQLADGLSLASLGHVRLRDIAAPTEVFQLTGPDLESEFPPLESELRVHRVSRPSTTLIGREGDLAEVRHALATSRLVSIVGPPGVGSSRLAAAVATDERVSSAFDHGAARLDLTSLDPTVALDALATKLGITIRPDRGSAQSLVDWLAGQNLLLFLEHGDHAVEVLAPFVESVLATAPGVSVLTTGSRPLGLPGESIHRLGPLAVDDAVELFRDRATAAGVAGHDLRLFPEVEVRALCEDLECLPLTVQTTAASAVVHTMAELRELVARGRSGTGVDEGPIAEAVALAIAALPHDLRSMLTASTVFATRFDRSAFASVCAPDRSEDDVARALAELVNRSLIHLTEGDDGPRFRLLAGIASQAKRQGSPDELAAADDRFRRFVLDLVSTAQAELRGPEERHAHLRLSRQFDNIRRVFDLALSTDDVATAAAVSTELWDYAFMRFNDEYFRWSRRLLDTFDDDGADAARHHEHEHLLAPVAGVAALGAWFGDEDEETQRLARRALDAERDLGLDFDLPARLALINATVYSGADAPPIETYAEQERYQQNRPELYFHVNVEVQNCIMATFLGQDDVAVRRGVEALRLAQESDNPSSLAFALWGLATAVSPDDPIQAESLLTRALDHARDVDNRWLTALVQLSLAGQRRRTGTAIDAIPLLIDLIDLLTRAGHQSHLWATLRLCALILGDLGHDGLSVQLRYWVDEAALAMPANPTDQAALDTMKAKLVEERGQAWIERTQLMASAWTTEAAVDLVRTELTRALDGQR